MREREGMTDLFVDLAQGYGSKPLGERIGYIVGVVVVLVIIIWRAATVIRNVRRPQGSTGGDSLVQGVLSQDDSEPRLGHGVQRIRDTAGCRRSCVGGINLAPAVGAFLMSLSTIVVAANAQLPRRTRLS
jgi:hypothetical protein